MPPRRLLLAFAVSLTLHAAAIGGGALKGLLAPVPPARLNVSLRPAETPPAEALVKNTLAADETKPEPQEQAKPAPPPKPDRQPAPAKPEKRDGKRTDKGHTDAVQKKLAEHVFYPPEAIARGLEGTVMLLIVFDNDGRIIDAQLAASSGHAILDNAAIRAAYAVGRMPGQPAGEAIKPVTFQLQ
jgi:periplasmic protein TonB